MREALDGYNGGVQIRGRLLTNLRYADDILLVACSKDELQELVNRLDRVSSRYNLMINIEKTKVMATANQQCNITIQGINLEKVATFPYLESIISDDTTCSADIKSRLAKASGIRASLSKVWKSHRISVGTKVKLMKSLVWSAASYGCESWHLKNRMGQD